MVIDLLHRTDQDLFSNAPITDLSQFDINKINIAYRCGWTHKNCVDKKNAQFCMENGENKLFS